MTQTLSLDGAWRLLPVDMFRQGFYPLDDQGWLEQCLPAHWQQHPQLERYVGKMVYRKRFSLEAGGLRVEGGEAANSSPQASSFTRHWLRLNGIFYWSQPYFNGVDLGRHEGYFTPQEHEVTAWLAPENMLLIEVECPEEHNKFGKRLITGVFSHWDCIDPLANPGGIWRPVELITTGPTRIKQVLLDTEQIDNRSARLRFRATLDTTVQGDALLRWTVAPKNFAGEVQVIEQRRPLQPGAQTIEGTLNVRDPQLWWTHDMGHPHCYTVTLTVLHDDASDEHTFTFGIRRFELRKWVPHLNGVRFFAKGNNYAPGDARIARVTAERCAEDLRLARECHMNMLRVHAHVATPALYGAADEEGILLWQDFPLQWLYRRSVLPEAQRQARQMIRQLYNHPSIGVWCMHNEAFRVADLADERLLTRLHTYFSVFVWDWNRAVLDTRLKQVAEAEDRTRAVVRSSGEYAVPFLHKGTDSHFYYGWFAIYGPLRAWEWVMRHFPNNIRFVTEFGAQSFPNLESSLKFMDADIARIDWDHLAARHQFMPSAMSHWLDWRAAPSLQALVDMTQNYQVKINRFYIDWLRFHKYRPTGGVLPFMFRDTGPAVQSAIIDYWGVPKRSYGAMQAAFSPQYAFTLLAKDHYPPGAPIDIPIYLVNDAQRAVPVELEARLLGPDGAELAALRRSLTLPADCQASEVDRLRLTPDTAGTYRLALRLKGAGEAIENEYDLVVDGTAHERFETKRQADKKTLARLGARALRLAARLSRLVSRA